MKIDWINVDSVTNVNCCITPITPGFICTINYKNKDLQFIGLLSLPHIREFIQVLEQHKHLLDECDLRKIKEIKSLL